MKKTPFLLLTILATVGCSSIKNQNKHLNDLISEENLKSDVDFVNNKLQKLQPKLYWYISKKDLDYKFDSLKSTITKPMTSKEFYRKLSPVVSEIKQGHTAVYPIEKQRTKKENKIFAQKGTGPFSQFDFEVNDNKLYVLKNKSYDKTIKPGSEVVAINGKNVSSLIQEYKTLFSSDGYNKTFHDRRLNRDFSSFFIYDNGILDSLKYDFKYNDTIRTVSIKRRVVDSLKTKPNETKKKLTAQEKAQIKLRIKHNSVYGYNPNTKTYNRNLKFIEKDSSVAVMSIKSFSIGNYKAFYDQSFRKINRLGSKALIIDLRNNFGGGLSEIAYLYTYLADSTFTFMDKSQVVSKTSLLKADYFKGASLSTKLVRTFVSPFYYSYMFFAVHKKADGNYYYSTQTKPRKVNPNAFKGKIYVLINGASFSASSIISSNLKGSKRAVFVGEETGGTYNGTVAGRMPTFKLPNSYLNLKLGLMLNAPHHKTEVEGRGIFPDKEIIPTLEDRIKGNDPEMEWILEDIKTKQ
jgi:C-terminal processing protease CtpA/Prc